MAFNQKFVEPSQNNHLQSNHYLVKFQIFIFIYTFLYISTTTQQNHKQ